MDLNLREGGGLRGVGGWGGGGGGEQTGEHQSSQIVAVLCNITLFLYFFIIHFIIHFGKFGPPYLGKTTAAARAALTQSYKCMLGLFVFP